MGARLGAFVLSAATALVILGASILPFLTPQWIRMEQDRSGAGALTGYDSAQLDQVTRALLGDLVRWGDFDVRIDGSAVLNDREQGHMRDVRGVFTGFGALVLASMVVVALAFRRPGNPESSAAAWRAVGAGARGLGIGLVVVGAFALFAFDAAFEVFHRLFFSAGTYTFDPRTDRLVQLFPEQFWSETTIAVGIVALTVAILTAWQAGRRAGAARSLMVLPRPAPSAASKART
jgi:integral membrane protein (TIGR01906 family)